MTERERWIEVARRLEDLASDDPESPELPSLLAELNAALETDCDARTFANLYKSQGPEEFVDSMLARRAALAELATMAPPSVTPETLAAFLEARPPGHYQDETGYERSRLDTSVVATISQAPPMIILRLLEEPLPAADRAAFLLDYRPPTSRDDVWVTARALGAALRGDETVRGEIAEALLEFELDVVSDPELAQLLALSRRNDIRLRAYVKKLKL
jgi:hypothetical protein